MKNPTRNLWRAFSSFESCVEYAHPSNLLIPALTFQPVVMWLIKMQLSTTYTCGVVKFKIPQVEHQSLPT